MIDIELLRDEKTRNATCDALARRTVALSNIERLLAADVAWREATQKLDDIRNKKREASTAIASAKGDVRIKMIQNTQSISEEEKKLSENVFLLHSEKESIWQSIPNIPLDDVQAGGEKDSELIAESATQPKPIQETPKDYATLMGSRISMERGAKVSGARFTYFSGDLARLELGIVSYVMDKLISEGFVHIAPPLLIGEQAMAGMGYLDQARDEIYKTQDDLYLVGTSEQSLGAMHMNEILLAEQLPMRYVAFSPCFRREAGSHGKDVKGILRLHQFDKVEMFSITTPEKSTTEHEFLLNQQRAIMDAFALPYRVVRLAAGDLGAPSAKTYDIETWIPSEGAYRETHSTSNTTDYQSRRLHIRYKNQEGKTTKVHMLNGTAVAIPRLLIALVEHHQRQDGSIAIPEPLTPYVPFTELSPTS